MQITTNIDIENDVVTATIAAKEVSEETAEALKDFTKKVEYDDIDFTAKVKIEDNDIVIADDADPDADEVSLKLVNKSYVLDDTLNIKLSIDANKLSEKELTTNIKDTATLAKAKAVVFVEKVKARIVQLLDEARKQNDIEIEGETEEVL